MDLLKWTRVLNTVYKQTLSFEQVSELLRDEYRIDAIRADLQRIAKEKES